MLQETAELRAELQDPRFTPRLALQLEAMLTELEARGATHFGGADVALWWLAEQIRRDRWRWLLERNEFQVRSTRVICSIVGSRLPRPPRWPYMAIVSYISQLWFERLPPGERSRPELEPLEQTELEAEVVKGISRDLGLL